MRRPARNGAPRHRPDVLTDQTSAHDPLNGCVPNGVPLADDLLLRVRHPQEYVARSVAAMGAHVEAMLDLRAAVDKEFAKLVDVIRPCPTRG